MMESLESRSPSSCLKTEPSTRANGFMTATSGTEEVYRFGQMAPDTKDTGETTEQMVEGDLFTLMEISTKENGWTTKRTVMEDMST